MIKVTIPAPKDNRERTKPNIKSLIFHLLEFLRIIWKSPNTNPTIDGKRNLLPQL